MDTSEDWLRLATLQLALSNGERDVFTVADEYFAWISKRTPIRMTVTAGPVTPQTEEIPMQIHDNEQFTLSVTEQDAKGFPVIDAVEWTVSDPTVVSLVVADDKQSALVVAGNPGSAVITLTDGTLSVTEAVDVIPGTATAIVVTEGPAEPQPTV
jgi:hypothetical protein